MPAEARHTLATCRITERPNEHRRPVYHEVDTVAINGGIDRVDHLSVGHPLWPKRGDVQRVEREDVVMCLAIVRRTRPSIAEEAKVIHSRRGLGNCGGIQGGHRAGNVVDDPVVEATTDGCIVIYLGEGVAQGREAGEAGLTIHPGEGGWNVLARAIAPDAARLIESGRGRHRAVGVEVRAGEFKDRRLGACGCWSGVSRGDNAWDERHDTDRDDRTGEHYPAQGDPQVMGVITTVQHHPILSCH